MEVTCVQFNHVAIHVLLGEIVTPVAFSATSPVIMMVVSVMFPLDIFVGAVISEAKSLKTNTS